MPRFGPTGKADNSMTTTAVVTIGMVVILALLMVSYNLGSSNTDSSKAMAADYRDRQQLVREELKTCQHALKADAMHRVQSTDKKVVELTRKTAEYEAKNQQLVADNEQLEKRSIECVERAETQKHIWSQEDISNAALVRQLEAQRQSLVANSTHLLKTKGMKSILIDAGLVNLRHENEALRDLLGMPHIKASLTDYLQDLITKWEGKTGFKKMENTILALNMTELQMTARNRNRQARYDFAREKNSQVRVFFQTKKGNTYERPSWLGRKGTGTLKKGVHDTHYFSLSSLPKQIRILYDYALCAMGHNVTTFVYPTHFKATPESNTIDSLVNILDTPLVNFCAECRPQESTGEFKLACQGTSTEATYGSIFFWRMRSRIRFSNQLLLAADEWIEARGLTNALAVRLRRGAWEQECATSWQFGKPQLSYSILLQNKSKEVSSTFNAQCYPSLQQVMKTVNKLVKDKGYSKAYFSSDADDDEWSTLQDGIAVPIVRRDTPAEQSVAIAIDIIIASKMKGLVTNRYDLTGSQMVELFLLEHNLKDDVPASSITVW